MNKGGIQLKGIALLATGFEDLEAFGTIALLRRAGIEIDLSSTNNQVTGKYGLTVNSDVTLDQVSFKDYQFLFLPGGMPGVNNLYQEEQVINLIKDFSKNNKLITAICAAPSILGKMGLLKDEPFTCYPGFEKDCIGGNYRDVPVIVSEHMITGRAAGSVHDFALAIIERIKGQEVMKQVKEAIFFDKR